MNCIKCGKKTKDGTFFCSSCLTNMEKHPVKPDAHIQLPNREKRAAPKKSSRKRYAISAEDQVIQLRKALRRAIVFCVAFAILLFFTAALLVQSLLKQPPEEEDLGTNYTYDSSMD